jgi:purine-nucleoside phosphorylase
MMANVKESKEFLEAKLAGFKPEVALVVGSGLGGVASAIANPVVVPYQEIPHFPKPTVTGKCGISW